MTPRLVKQMLYGALYLLVLALIIYGIYYIWFKPAPTFVDTEISQLKPLNVNWAISLPANENEISLLAKISNPNLNFGRRSFFYEFKVFGPFSALLKTIPGQSFVYPGEEKYLMEAALKIIPNDVSRVELVIANENLIWQSKEELVKPHLSSRSIKTEIENQAVKVSGLVKNEDPLSVSRIKIFAILFDNQNKILNASYTAVTNLQGLTEQSFTVNFPKGDWIKDLDPHRTEIFLEPEPE